MANKRSISGTEKNRRINLFKSSFQKFIDYFGVYDYAIHFFEDEDTEEYSAYVKTRGKMSNSEGEGQVASVFYSKTWIEGKNLKNDEIKKVAFHEFLELLLLKLRDYAMNNTIVISDREIDNEVHRIIRIFENTIYERGLIDR